MRTGRAGRRAREGRLFTAADLAGVLGVAPAALDGACRRALGAVDLSYRLLRGVERERCFLAATRELSREDLERSGPHRRARWEQGWRENLAAFTGQGHRLESLRPRYMKHRRYRLGGDYIQAREVRFEEALFTACRIHLFHRYLAGVDHVVEFGCGTGTSLLLLEEVLPGKRLVGCDWAESSGEILREIGKRSAIDLTGVRLDMFAPHDDFPFPPGSAVMTFTAMEQLGGDFIPFAEYLLAHRPGICLHLEPTPELYDPEDLFDYLALAYHRRRNYLTGFLPWLREGARRGRLELVEARRLGFGSFFHEGYTLLVWRPR